MHENVTHNRRYAKFRDFAEAVLGFLRETVPRRFDEFSSTITDNFRHRPEGFSDPRVTPLYISSWRCFPSWIRHPELTAQGEQRLPPHFQQRPGHPLVLVEGNSKSGLLAESAQRRLLTTPGVGIAPGSRR